jgi:hypothetical protein
VIGFAVGVAAGAVQFWLLAKFTKRVTSGALSPSTILLGFLQLLLPIGVLLGVAILWREDILLTGVGITGALFVGVFVRFILMRQKKKPRGNKHD